MMRSVAIVCLLAASAWADKPASLAHYEKGKKAYAAGKFGARTHRKVAQWYKWHDVSRADSRVFTAVNPQINQTRCGLNPAERALTNSIRITCKRDDRAIVVRITRYIEQVDARRANCLGNGRDDFWPSSFTKVRHTLDERHSLCFRLVVHDLRIDA